LLGIEKAKGTLAPGADADILFLNDDLEVQRVFVAGEEVEINAS
jgi:N-acetylglucosamine-6-phosphate deacetylase